MIAQMASRGLEYAFIAADGRQCTPLLFCKEFLLDATWGTIHNERAALYGFVFDAGSTKTPPVDLNHCRLLLRNKHDTDFVQSTERCIAFLQQLEAEMEIEETSMQVCDDPPKDIPVVAFIGSPHWMIAPPMLSLYSLLIRVGMTYKEGDVWKYMERVADGKVRTTAFTDAQYLRSSLPTIRRLIISAGVCFGSSSKLQDNWPLDLEEEILHEDMGIVAFARGKARQFCPQWYE